MNADIFNVCALMSLYFPLLPSLLYSQDPSGSCGILPLQPSSSCTCNSFHPGCVINSQVAVEDPEDVSQDHAEVLGGHHGATLGAWRGVLWPFLPPVGQVVTEHGEDHLNDLMETFLMLSSCAVSDPTHNSLLVCVSEFQPVASHCNARRTGRRH